MKTPLVNTVDRPPIGIMPERIWKERRIRELVEVMERYTLNDYQIPTDWVDELSRHVHELNKQP